MCGPARNVRVTYKPKRVRWRALRAAARAVHTAGCVTPMLPELSSHLLTGINDPGFELPSESAPARIFPSRQRPFIFGLQRSKHTERLFVLLDDRCEGNPQLRHNQHGFEWYGFR